ncbi:PIN domain-containing protein [Candidatus Woesearchaeota archaeon]|nr:PIN domain-containing protein [Candidatus Woesearchaeota archaeon]MCF8013868.1 PIN domain-containing protein [Candidatus Woesearchaeota archaeon]
MIYSEFIHQSSTPEKIRNRNTTLLDTCFIINELEKGNEKKLENFCKLNETYITSFNLEELKHVMKYKKEINHQLKRLLEQDTIKILLLPIKPGERKEEINYANKTDQKILQIIHDPSDAVLVAAAIKSNSNILTKDKHHIFTAALENQLEEYKIKIFKELKEI